MFLAPQSPHRYSTPRIAGAGGGTADAEEEAGGGGAGGPAALPPPVVGVEFMFVSFILRACVYISGGWRREGVVSRWWVQCREARSERSKEHK
jgi:hypothetical protein